MERTLWKGNGMCVRWTLVLKIISFQLLGRLFLTLAGKYDPEVLCFFVRVRLIAVVGVAVVTES